MKEYQRQPINSSHSPGYRIGFISTRFEGTDGVTLETEKWVEVLNRLNCESFFFAGACSWDEGRSYVIPEANFKHPNIALMNEIAYSSRTRPEELTKQIYILKDFLKQHIAKFVNQYDIDLLIAENALSIPLHIPLGLALTEYIAETGIPVIGHHHDLFWERKRFLVNGVWDFINMCFPPHLPTIRHVVINSSAANQLSLRTGISSMLIPNVMDFDSPPPPPDDYSNDVRTALGLTHDELLFLQPTRVVPRKGIEHAIELTKKLDMKACLVISHASGDEGFEYEHHLRDYAKLLGIKVNFEAEIIRDKRGWKDGRKVYKLTDVYPHADLVTYPSDIEGFGNAFLEALYFRRPIVVNNYSIFNIDIKPKGFRVIEFDGFITQQTVDFTRRILANPAQAQEMADYNFLLGHRYYSFSVLERRLHTLLKERFGEE